MLHKAGFKYSIVDKQDMFNKIMHATDFTKAKTGLDAVKIMFNTLFPTIERVVDDNEVLLKDQEKVLKNFAELDEKYKNLLEEYEKIRVQLQEATNEKIE